MRNRTIARACGGYTAVGLIVVAVMAICWLLYEREAHQVAGRQADLEVIRVNLLAQLLRGELRPAVDDLQLLADGAGLRTYIETGTDAALQAAGGQVVPDPQLQNKADRPYFRQASVLAPGMLYISSFDLNLEGLTKSRSPPRPTLRFAVPVFDAKRRRSPVPNGKDSSKDCAKS